MVFTIEADDKEAQKSLNKIKKAIQNLEVDTATKNVTKKRMEQEAAYIEAALKKAYQAGDDALLKELEKRGQSIASKTENIDNAIKENADSMTVLKEEAAQYEKRLIGAAKAAKLAAQYAKEQEAIAEEQTKSIGEQVDNAFLQITQLENAMKRVRERFAELKESIGIGLKGILAAPFQLLGATLRRIPGLMKIAFSTGGKIVVAFGKGVINTAKRLNVFSRAFEAIGPKIKRLAGLVKRVFVFSVITAGLRHLRSQLSAFLEQNTALTLAVNRTKAALTTAFQPIYEAVVPALETLLNALTRVLAAVAQFNAMLFGTTAKQAQANAKALTAQAEATKAAGGAAKDASKSLASFDEINKLSDSTGSAGASAVGFNLEFDDTQIDSWGQAFSDALDRMIEKVQQLPEVFSKAAEQVNGFFQKLLETLTFPGVQEKVAQLGRNIAIALNGLVADIDWYTIGAALGAGLNMALSFLVGFIYSFDWIQLGGAIAEAINGLVSQIDWYAFGQLLWAGFKIAIEFLAGLLLNLDMKQLAEAASNVAKGFFNGITETLQKIDWAEIGRQVAEFLRNVDWAGVAEACFTAIGAAFGAAAAFLWGLIQDAWEKVVQWWYDTANEDGKHTIDGLLAGIVWKIDGIFVWLNQHVVTPFVNAFKKLLGISSPSKVMAEIGGFVAEGFLDGLKNGWKSVTSWLSNALNSLIASVKSGVSSVKSGISSITSSISGKVTSAISVQSVRNAMPSIDTLQIPRLAMGAVIPPNREFMAVLGDQSAGRNLEAPERLIREIVASEMNPLAALLQQLIEVTQEGKVVQLDDMTIGRVIYNTNKSEKARHGGTLVNVGWRSY